SEKHAIAGTGNKTARRSDGRHWQLLRGSSSTFYEEAWIEGLRTQLPDLCRKRVESSQRRSDRCGDLPDRELDGWLGGRKYLRCQPLPLRHRRNFRNRCEALPPCAPGCEEGGDYQDHVPSAGAQAV